MALLDFECLNMFECTTAVHIFFSCFQSNSCVFFHVDAQLEKTDNKGKKRRRFFTATIADHPIWSLCFVRSRGHNRVERIRILTTWRMSVLNCSINHIILRVFLHAITLIEIVSWYVAVFNKMFCAEYRILFSINVQVNEVKCCNVVVIHRMIESSWIISST